MISFLSISFIDFSLKDLIDILLVAYLLFVLYKLVRGSVAINIFVGLISIYFLWKFVGFMKMRMLSEILGQFISVGVLALIIVFQQEIRKFLLIIGTANFRNKRNSSLWKVFGGKFRTEIKVDIILQTLENFSQSFTGALIVFTKSNDLETILESGVEINAEISNPLLENIFFKNSPLHDGALIITNNKIKAARCVLPLSNNPDFPSDLGLRHRAAMGISEHSDALCIVVSEQTGLISITENGKIIVGLKLDEIKNILNEKLSN